MGTGVVVGEAVGVGVGVGIGVGVGVDEGVGVGVGVAVGVGIPQANNSLKKEHEALLFVLEVEVKERLIRAVF